MLENCKFALVNTEPYNGGTPCAVKVARTVWSGGKGGDYLKALPIAIKVVRPSATGRDRGVSHQ